MLHIITPVYHYKLIQKVYQTIPLHEDIRWHIAYSQLRGIPTNLFISNDPRIILYPVNCDDTDIVSKRNAVFSAIKEGYFYLLDDDTKFMEEVYTIYTNYQQAGFRGMIIGNMLIRKYEKTNVYVAPFPTDDPAQTVLDTGMAIASVDVLESVKWANIPVGATYFRDNLFWSSCFCYFGKEGVIQSNRIISFYNFYGPLMRIRKQFLGIPLKININNPKLARLYDIMVKIKKRIIK